VIVLFIAPTELPTIIAGDFNATPDAASIRYLAGRQSLGGRSVST